MKGILGKKLGMSQVFTENGTLVPVTIVEVCENVVLQVKTDESKDGYFSTTLATGDKRTSLFTKPEMGKFEKQKLAPKRFVKEIRNMKGYQIGDKLDASIFKQGEIVDATAISKGKGTAGVIKRYNFACGPMAHGSGYHRGIGSMGSIAANRIFKGKKMPGRMGNERVTIQNLKVVMVDPANNTLLIKGSIPGPRNNYVIIRNAIKNHSQKFIDFKLLVRNKSSLVEVDKKAEAKK